MVKRNKLFKINLLPLYDPFQRHELRGLEGISSRPKQVRRVQWTRQQGQAVFSLAEIL